MRALLLLLAFALASGARGQVAPPSPSPPPPPPPPASPYVALPESRVLEANPGWYAVRVPEGWEAEEYSYEQRRSNPQQGRYRFVHPASGDNVSFITFPDVFVDVLAPEAPADSVLSALTRQMWGDAVDAWAPVQARRVGAHTFVWRSVAHLEMPLYVGLVDVPGRYVFALAAAGSPAPSERWLDVVEGLVLSPPDATE